MLEYLAQPGCMGGGGRLEGWEGTLSSLNMVCQILLSH